MPFITALNPSFCIIYEDFSEEIIVVSDNSDKSLLHFLDNNYIPKSDYIIQKDGFNYYILYLLHFKR
jgi:hypothetical protein